jgi:hypothetical protein
MAVSQIGTFTFVSMLPPPPFPYQNLEFEARAGVNGYAAWKTGIMADQFQVSTLIDLPTIAAAATIFSNYQALVAASPVGIAYAGMPLPFYVLVQKVEAEEMRATVLGVGGINGTSRAILRAKWTLIPWVLP